MKRFATYCDICGVLLFGGTPKDICVKCWQWATNVLFKAAVKL